MKKDTTAENIELKKQLEDFLLPDEPRRINANEIDQILEHCINNDASGSGSFKKTR